MISQLNVNCTKNDDDDDKRKLKTEEKHNELDADALEIVPNLKTSDEKISKQPARNLQSLNEETKEVLALLQELFDQIEIHGIQ